MKPGETRDFACPQCMSQFRILYEPDAEPIKSVEVAEMIYISSPVICCPFCRGTIQEDE